MAERKRGPWVIEKSAHTSRQLRALRAVDRSRIEREIESKLRHQPDVEVGNRFVMRPNELASWELWVDPWRVFYDLLEDEHTVFIVAIGRKEGEKLVIDGQEVKV